MKRFLLILLAVLVLGVPEMGAQRFARCQSCTRDLRGKIVRSQRVKSQFMRGSGFPRGRYGYQVDHKVPLACGGRDVASNLQWLTVAEHRAKTRRDAHCSR